MATSPNAADPSPLLLAREEVVHRDDEEDAPHILLAFNKEDEEMVPPSSHFVRDSKFKIWQFRYPLKVLAINLVSLVLVQALMVSGDPYHNYYRSGFANLQYQTMLRTGLVVSFLIFLWDANLCFRGALSMEQKLKDQDSGSGQTIEPSTDIEGEGSPAAEATNTTEAKEFDFVQFSRNMDTIFGSTSSGNDDTAKSSFVVCLLYTLFSFAAWQSAASGTGFLQVQFMKTDDIPEKGKCFESSIFSDSHGYYDDGDDERWIGALSQDPNFKTLPLDVRAWISSRGQGSKRVGYNQSLPFLQLEGGAFVFSKAMSNRYSYSRDTGGGSNKPGVVSFDPISSAVTEYAPTCRENDNDYYSDGEIELIGFPADPPYTAWCGVFKESGQNILQDEVICYNNKTGLLGRFECLKDTEGSWNGWGGGQYSFYTSATDSNNKLWMANTKQFHKRNQKSTNMVSLNTYDTETMQNKLVLSWNTTKKRNQGQKMTLNPNCSGFYWTTFAVSLVTLSLLAVYLYRLDVPSCTAPAALAVSLLMSALMHPAAAGVFLLVLACGCLYLLVAVRRSSMIWRYLSTSMLIWALYTLQIASSWVFWSPSFGDDDFFEAEVFFSFLPFPLLSCLVAAATNVLLNHPFFQVLAVCFGSLSIFSFVFALMGLNFLLVPMMSAVLSLGCFRAGTLLQMYRVHLIVHARRLCRKMSTCSAVAPGRVGNAH